MPRLPTAPVMMVTLSLSELISTVAAEVTRRIGGPWRNPPPHVGGYGRWSWFSCRRGHFRQDGILQGLLHGSRDTRGLGRPRSQPFEQMIPNAQRIRDDRERRIHR